MYGYGVVKDLFRRYDSDRLAGLIAFVPMWVGDSNEAATDRASDMNDDRVTHWWDETRESDRPFAAMLGVHWPAWDIYLLYGPGTIWEGSTPPAPNFWMHQLPTEHNTYPDGYLDAIRLEHELQQLLQALRESEGTHAVDVDHHLSPMREPEN